MHVTAGLNAGFGLADALKGSQEMAFLDRFLAKLVSIIYIWGQHKNEHY